VIRRARPEDAEGIARVHLAARQEAMPYLPELHTEAETLSWIRDVVLPRQEVYVAVENGAVVGFVALDHDMVEQLYVGPAAQSRGVGTELLDLAKELRAQGFRLWVFQRNEGARRFYERRGLHLVELTDGATNEEREADALYEWRPATPASRGRASPRAGP
jgi:ribosomal protein S18 acetylase RimI-like enzyme